MKDTRRHSTTNILWIVQINPYPIRLRNFSDRKLAESEVTTISTTAVFTRHGNLLNPLVGAGRIERPAPDAQGIGAFVSDDSRTALNSIAFKEIVYTLKSTV